MFAGNIREGQNLNRRSIIRRTVRSYLQGVAPTMGSRYPFAPFGFSASQGGDRSFVAPLFLFFEEPSKPACFSPVQLTATRGLRKPTQRERFTIKQMRMTQDKLSVAKLVILLTLRLSILVRALEPQTFLLYRGPGLPASRQPGATNLCS